jgi:Ca2+-transporting ATPase
MSFDAALVQDSSKMNTFYADKKSEAGPANSDLEASLWQVTGLSEHEALSRLKAEGYNELPSARPRTILAIALSVVREPMFLLLLACGTLYFFLGDIEEALVLLSFVFVIIAITFFQERKTERALEALRDLSSPRALVIRDGQQKRIAGREVVCGDSVLLAEGDRVPADGVVLFCSNLAADESLLTGEAVPVNKQAGQTELEMDRPGGDSSPFVYSGTLVVKGRGLVMIKATGLQTEIGKIGKALKTIEPEDTKVQKEVRHLVRNLAIIGVLLCIAVTVIFSLTRDNWLQGFLAGIALAMAILPEEFPVVLTVFMALGAWRISQQRVLTRRVPAIETLGAATVLCVDKTGTLTQNRMSISELYAGQEVYNLPANSGQPLPEKYHTLLEFGILASQRDPFDPMEKAFHACGADYLAGTEHLHANWTLIREYPLSPKLLALSHVWQAPEPQSHNNLIAAKGAPEAIADLCHLTPDRFEALEKEVGQLAASGLRVLGIARAYFKEGSILPSDQHDFDFEFLGLVGLSDPLRPKVAEALKECYAAGIRVVMITGDYPATAQHIAHQIGLTPTTEYITGPELQQMTEEELRQRIGRVNIFARVLPEQKLSIVKALKANGEIVAMTGDGVNDAPALKAAQIGIAMGGRGTDVAREAGALVLLDDDFSSIVHAIRLGRRIWDNLRKAMAYILAIHVPIAGMSLLPVLFGWPLMLLPVHIVFLELIIDPACSIVFEAEREEASVMSRPPRSSTEDLFGWKIIVLSLIQGLVVLLTVLAVLGVARNAGASEETTRTLVFITLVTGNLGLILVNRSWTRTILKMIGQPNTALWWVVGGALAFLGLALYVPFLRELFRFSEVKPVELVLGLLAGLVSVAWFDILKLTSFNITKKGGVGKE